MRILHVITELDNMYGAQRHLVECVKDHIVMGLTCKVISGKTGVASELLSKKDIQITCIPELQNSYFFIHDIKAIRKIVAEIKSFKPDIVISHSSKAGIIARIACRITKTPNLFTVHGWSFEKGTPFYQHITGYIIEYLLKGISDKYYCVSEHTAAFGHHKIGINREKLLVCANVHEKRTLSVPDKNIFHTVLMVAGFRKQKDHPTAIKAMNEIVHRFQRKDIKLILIGDGPERINIENLIKHYDLEDYIHLAGETTDIDSYYKTCDIVILPTHYEGLPIALIEAIQNAKPIIATNVSGVSEIVVNDYNGNLIAENDYNALADNIVDYYDNNLMNIKGENALKVYSDKFRYESICAKMNDIINNLVSSSIYH